MVKFKIKKTNDGLVCVAVDTHKDKVSVTRSEIGAQYRYFVYVDLDMSYAGFDKGAPIEINKYTYDSIRKQIDQL